MISKKFITFLITIFLLISMTCTVFSSVTTVSENGGQAVKISGTIPSGAEKIPVAIDVFAPNKGYADLETAIAKGENVTTVLANRYEVKTDKDGAYEHIVDIVDDPDVEGDAISGVYTVIVWPMDSENSESTTFLYTSVDDMITNYEKIEKTSSYEEVLKVLDENVYGVGVPYAFYEDADKTDIAKMVFDYIENNSFDPNDVEACADIMKKAALIAGLTTGDVANAFDYETELEIDDTEIGDLYKKEYALPLYETISKAFADKDIESFDEFEEVLAEAFILAVVKKSDGVGNAKEVIDAFADELDIEPTDNLDVYRKVMDVNYESLNDLTNAYEKAYKAQDSGKGSGNSSGGRGGSGGGSGKVLGDYGVSPEIMESAQNSENIPMDIFVDLGSVEWAKEAIVYLAEKGIVSGKGESKYYPNDNITREEFTKIVAGAFLADAEEKEISFTDVASDEWYAPYIKKAFGAGVITGHSEELFGVGELITREDMVVILYRVAILKGIAEETEATLVFDDANEISDYAKTAVAVMAEMEIVNGKELGVFAPKDYATRAETAKMIYRLIMK